MSQTIDVNGQSINYPETGDTNWGDEATDFAVQTSAALGKLGLASGTSVDIAQTLDVTGNTTLDANLSVGGNASVTGNITVNGNSTLGNGTSDTTAITGILNVDSGVLYVDPTNNRVGINDATPSEALDVTGNLNVTGDITFGGSFIAPLIKASTSAGLGIDNNSGTDVALFGGSGGIDTVLYGGLTGTTGNFTNTTDATSSTDGALKTAGGVGIAKKLFVGTGILTGDGSAAAPSISPISDPNSGIYSIGADKIGFSSNGARVGEFGDGYGGFIGNVIQVKSTTKTDTWTQSSVNTNTFYDVTGLSVSITPKYANSKILILATIQAAAPSAGNVHTRLIRDSTAICIGDASGSRLQASNTLRSQATPYNLEIASQSINFLDSPNTTSSTTYKIAMTGGATYNNTLYVNRNGGDANSDLGVRTASTITVMEIQQ